MNIMVVDDHDDQRTLMKCLLEEWGHDVQAAANGEEAVEFGRHRRSDVVLMDLSMPLMNGFEATRRLRLLPLTAKAHIIALSGYLDNLEWRQRAVAAGCNKCFAKPIAATILHAELFSVEAAARHVDNAL
jgi:CheY-like chemotaxis protein